MHQIFFSSFINYFLFNFSSVLIECTLFTKQIYSVLQWLQARHLVLLLFLPADGRMMSSWVSAELFKAIKESRFAVVILSKNYASSTWCLNELVEIIACEKMVMTILPIFYNVDPSDVQKQKGTFAHPFDEYEKRFEEKVGTWRAALNHVANICGCHVDNR